MRGPAAARSTANETVEAVESILGRGAKVRGRVGGDGDLRVEGQVEGDVRISGQLAIEEGGAITGDVAARGSVTIRAGAQVAGNMNGAEVVLEEGASFTGRIEAEFDMPAELSEEAPTAPRHAAHAAHAARGR